MRTPKERARIEQDKAILEAAGLAEPKKAPKAPKPVAKPVDLHEFTADGDLVDVWERRMLNPSLKPANPIRLKTPGMHLRWINLSNNGRYQRARYEEGWAPVLRDELKDEKEIYGVSYTTEGWVCRGEKQQEMLMKIPEAVFKRIQRAKYDEVLKTRKQIKDRMQNDAAAHFGDKYNANRGDQIADSLSNFKGDVRFGTERVEPDETELELAQHGVEG